MPAAANASSTPRKILILLQSIGLLSILPYPFVLIATISSLASGRDSGGSLPRVFILFYPAVWIALYLLSWRALNRGAARLALTLSSIPAIACLLAIAVYLLNRLRF